MKVLQIIDSLATGGAEKLLLDSLPLYRESGIEMDILVLMDKNYPFMQQLEASKICTIYKLGRGSVYNPKFIFRIAKLLPHYDLAHVHLFPAQYWTVLAKQLSKANTKLIFTEHNTSNRRNSNRFFAIIDRWFYKKYNCLVAISEEIKNILLHHTNLPKSRFVVIRNGINLTAVKNAIPLEIRELGQDKFSLIQVSSFRPQKDQATLIRALKYLPEEVHLLLVGEGPTRSNCEVLVRKLALEKRVHFLGNRNDVSSLLKTADVVILSSHHEGMSLSSIEGMASGRPFIASNVPGLTAVVQDAGLLFPAGDDKKLAALILCLKRDENLRQKVAETCQKRATQYDIRNMVDKYIKLYEQVLT